MGNYTCDFVPDAGTSPYGTTACSPSPGQPAPNRYVVVRAEGVAIDGRSKDIVEVTWKIGPDAPQGAGGTFGTGGPVGGSAGNPGGTGGSPGSAGGSAGTAGTEGSAGTGGSPSGPCLNYAVTAISPCPSGLTPGCIAINSASKVDGFSSTSGPYGGGNITSASVAMTCSKAMATSCPNNCPSGCITGTVTYGYSSPLSASTLPAPSYTANSTRITIPSNTTITPAAPSTVTYLEEINVNTGGTLTLKAGRYVVNYLNLNQFGTLYIDDSSGPVTIWVLTFTGLNSAVAVKSGKAESFWLVYNGTNQINNNTNNSFTGVIFAPVAEINLNYVVTGAVVGGKVTLNGPSKVHFDTHLTCP